MGSGSRSAPIACLAGTTRVTLVTTTRPSDCTHTSPIKAQCSARRPISPGPREGRYVIDGLLGNNTILKIRSHTTDSEGWLDLQYALLYVLGYEFVPRIKNLKDKQLYRIEKDRNDSIFAPFLTKIADTELVEEQWDTIMRLGMVAPATHGFGARGHTATDKQSD